MKAIINARIVLEDGILENSSVLFDTKIQAVAADALPENCSVIDAEGQFLFPGLIDLHMHGYCGHEVLEGSEEAQRFIARQLLKDGVTGFLPTLGSAPLDDVARALTAVRACMKDSGGAKIHGAHMEGVFISPDKRGAHDAKLLLPPDLEFLLSYLDVIKIMITAPEMYPDFVSWCVGHGIVCSMGHTNATYAQAMEGVRRGATQVTHLFNAMRGISHREPGIAGAALLSDSINIELIADTVHVAKELYKLVYKLKGPDRILLITDSSVASGMGPGTFQSNNRTVYVDECVGRLENGTISSSVVPLRRDMLNFHRNSGAPLYEAARMASLNPARVLGIDKELGSLRVGKCADMFMADNELQVSCTFLDGDCVFRRQ